MGFATYDCPDCGATNQEFVSQSTWEEHHKHGTVKPTSTTCSECKQEVEYVYHPWNNRLSLEA